jgi:hypothetical protein
MGKLADKQVIWDGRFAAHRTHKEGDPIFQAPVPQSACPIWVHEPRALALLTRAYHLRAIAQGEKIRGRGYLA